MGGWGLPLYFYKCFSSHQTGWEEKYFNRNPMSGAARIISNDMRISVSLSGEECNGAINPKTVNQINNIKFAAFLAKLPWTRRQNPIEEAAGIKRTI